MVRLGDTFGFAKADEINIHLFIVISDPAIHNEKIVTANFTSWEEYKDQSCIVLPGEHPFITKKTCVRYSRDRLITQEQYEHCVKNGDIIPHEPVSEPLLKKILKGAAISKELPLGNYKILSGQGLIDDRYK